MKDDFISRCAAADAVRLLFQPRILDAKTEKECDLISALHLRAQRTVQNIPAADVAPVRHACWVPEEHVDKISPAVTYRTTKYYCSACGRALVAWEKPIDAPYCHCGAKMDERDDVEERAQKRRALEKLDKLIHANFGEPDDVICIKYEDGHTERV